MKWSDIEDNDFYIMYDENQKVIRGNWLITMGIDLNEIPNILFDTFNQYNTLRTSKSKYESRKVLVTDIIGTSHKDYGDITLINAFIRLKRLPIYINKVTPNRYFRNLKQSTDMQQVPVILSPLENGKYYIDGNGNHRMILYKLMFLIKLCKTFTDIVSEKDLNNIYYKNNFCINEIISNYWLNALIRTN